MLTQLLRYGSHRLFGKGDIRLAMTILVKNESDIIADNIRVHAKLGVDCFIVMDNDSTDGTREILDSLRDVYDLQIIDQKEQTYRQRQWMTQLAVTARDQHGADWVISNDADEFWLPKHGNLKSGLDRKGSCISISRHNMLLTEECLLPGYRYFDSALRVDNPVYYSKQAQRTQDNIALPLVTIKPKIIINPHGLISIKGGNHHATHVANLFASASSDALSIFHYPIRSYAQFEKNIANRERLAKMDDVRMGDHYFRWAKMYAQGRLEEEYQRFIITSREIATLERVGIVSQDTFPRTIIAGILDQTSPGVAGNSRQGHGL